MTGHYAAHNLIFEASYEDLCAVTPILIDHETHSERWLAFSADRVKHTHVCSIRTRIQEPHSIDRGVSRRGFAKL